MKMLGILRNVCLSVLMYLCHTCFNTVQLIQVMMNCQYSFIMIALGLYIQYGGGCILLACILCRGCVAFFRTVETSEVLNQGDKKQVQLQYANKHVLQCILCIQYLFKSNHRFVCQACAMIIDIPKITQKLECHSARLLLYAVEVESTQQHTTMCLPHLFIYFIFSMFSVHLVLGSFFSLFLTGNNKCRLQVNAF